MSRSKKPRKPYRPRQVIHDPVSWAIAGAHTHPADVVAKIMQIPRGAFDALRAGCATREEWNVLCQCFNVSEALADVGIGPNLLPEIRAGLAALDAIACRMIERRTATCYAEELAAINEAIAMHRAQLITCTQAEYSRALSKVRRTILSGGADNVAERYQKMATVVV